ncbi:MAG: 60S ribosomal protein L31 [Nitrososphaerota archaeon]|jgi:large subunit ribosomal protein L31e|nr:60S ribosomal protein L31 [Nitrososphaerota archaeon]
MINANDEQQTIQETELIETQQEETLPTEAIAEPKETVTQTEKTKPKKKDDPIVEERIYTIPLQRALVRPPKKRAPRAMQLLKIFVARHMKMPITITEEDEELPHLIITPKVNEKIWSKGIEKPPRKIRVRITKDRNDDITVYLAEA